MLECNGQESYLDSMTRYLDAYVQNHEVIKGEDKPLLQFYPVNEEFRVLASFEKKNTSNWFGMEGSGMVKKIYRIYGVIRFSIHDTLVKLNLYQSQALINSDEYRNQLFLPFTDLTTGEETYESGRYLDLTIDDIIDNRLVLDFNKAYNPYCAYVEGKYNCPLPPKENDLTVAILAGEKKFGKAHD